MPKRPKNARTRSGAARRRQRCKRPNTSPFSLLTPVRTLPSSRPMGIKMLEHCNTLAIWSVWTPAYLVSRVNQVDSYRQPPHPWSFFPEDSARRGHRSTKWLALWPRRAESSGKNGGSISFDGSLQPDSPATRGTRGSLCSIRLSSCRHGRIVATNVI